MASTRKTINRETVVEVANRMILHLSESGTKQDADKREAIIAVVDSILLEGNSYKGFRSLNPPKEFKSWEDFYAYPQQPGQSFTWDDTRRTFL